VVSAENSVKSARVTVEKARQTLSETKLYAPTDGVVASIKDTVGESVTGTGTESSSSSSGSGATSATGSSATGSSATGSSGAGGSAASGTGTSATSGSGTSATGKSAAASGSAATSGAGTSGTSATGTGTSSGGGTGSTGTSEAGTSGSSGAGSGSGPSETGGATSTSTSDSSGGVFHDLVDTSDTSSAGSGSDHEIAATSTGGASTSGASSTGSSSTGTSSESSSSSTSSSFIELVDLQGYQVVVPLSESEIGNVHVGQIATVTVEALEGRKFAAQVVSLAVLSTSSSGAVSYDVTFQLEQSAAGLKPGMSATAEVVVKQAEGINVPTSAITADSVTVERGGKQVSQAVTTGLAGNTSTIVLSGLKAGETVLLPAASTTGSSAASLTSKLGGLSKSGGLGSSGGFPSGGGGGFPSGGGPP